MRFIIEESDETITTHSGLSLIGLLLDKSRLGSRLKESVLPDINTPDIVNRDVAYSSLGLLYQGMNDFNQ